MTMNNAATPKTLPSVGIRAWGTPPPQQRKFDDNLPQIPFLKFKAGSNKMRVVSNLSDYFQARFKFPLSKMSFGDRIRTSYPTYPNCPVLEFLGLEGKARSYVVVIDRTDQQLKIADISSLTVEQIETNVAVKNEDREEGSKISPRDFDITIKFNPKSTKPTGFYTVVAHDCSPMSAKDLALVEEIGGQEVLEKILTRK